MNGIAPCGSLKVGELFLGRYTGLRVRPGVGGVDAKSDLRKMQRVN